MAGTRAFVLRQAIEAELAGSFAGALSPRFRTDRPRLPFGIGALDRATGGGAPAGAVTELVGLGSTGKTGAAMRVAAGAMRAGKMCAWVDASDGFDPRTGADNGMLLPQLLWVRCGGEPERVSHATAAATTRPEERSPLQSKGTHPRDEQRGMGEAVNRLFAPGSASAYPAARGCSHGSDRGGAGLPDTSRTGMHSTRNRQALGTPGAPNAPLSPLRRAPHVPRPAFRPVPRSEQVADDRLPGRRVANPVALPAAAAPGGNAASPRPQSRPWARLEWKRLDQALRAADLLLQGGGFALVVLDLGGVAPEQACRIPAATWFRFRALAEASGTAFLLLSEAPCARSNAGLVLQFKPLRLEPRGGSVVEAARYEAEVTRQRFDAPPRKQPKASWQASPFAGVGMADEPAPGRGLMLAWTNFQGKLL